MSTRTIFYSLMIPALVLTLSIGCDQKEKKETIGQKIDKLIQSTQKKVDEKIDKTKEELDKKVDETKTRVDQSLKEIQKADFVGQAQKKVDETYQETQKRLDKTASNLRKDKQISEASDEEQKPAKSSDKGGLLDHIKGGERTNPD
ncbi:MAG: hypothetical protein SGI98_11865 [Verrucomicrobiota bacterium]|nr:hypothetical protein [Verrucomicrobiota bacterium]